MKNSNKKGFTIVELVIVIAVIAILAAVLIPTFSGLVKKANVSADIQAVRQMNTALEMEQAKNGAPKNLNEVLSVLSSCGYRDSITPVSSNTIFGWSKTYNIVMLIEVDESGKMTKLLYPTDDAEAKQDFDQNYSEIYNLTGYDESTISKVATAIENAANKTLEIKNDGSVTMTDVVNAASKGAMDFKDVTISLASDAEVDVAVTGRINQFNGKIEGNGNTITLKNIEAIHDTSKSTKNAGGYLYSGTAEFDENGKLKQKVGTAFINYLGEGGVVKDVNIVYDQENLNPTDPGNKYTYFGGIVGYLNGGTIEGCTVSGYIKQYNRVGGIVGTAYTGTIKNCTVKDLIIKSLRGDDGGDKTEYTDGSKHQVEGIYQYVGGIVAWVGDKTGTVKGTLTIEGCKVENLKCDSDDGNLMSGKAIVAWAELLEGQYLTINNCTINLFTYVPMRKKVYTEGKELAYVSPTTEKHPELRSDNYAHSNNTLNGSSID